MTQLLNPDGTASVATFLLMSHHAFRRDLARFASALSQGEVRSPVRDEWTRFCAALHGHHHSEDANMFPGLVAQHPELDSAIARLSADHRRIDPLLERGTRTFDELDARAAAAAVSEVRTLIDAHLSFEEEVITPWLRDTRGFPPPASDAEAAMYADGFAWSSDGIAPDVLDKVYASLPVNLTERLPAARAAFAERCASVWGPTPLLASRSSIPSPR